MSTKSTSGGLDKELESLVEQLVRSKTNGPLSETAVHLSIKRYTCEESAVYNYAASVNLHKVWDLNSIDNLN